MSATDEEWAKWAQENGISELPKGAIDSVRVMTQEEMDERHRYIAERFGFTGSKVEEIRQKIRDRVSKGV